MRTFVRALSWILGFLVILTAAVAWWFVYRPLPQLDGTISLSGLQQDHEDQEEADEDVQGDEERNHRNRGG